MRARLREIKETLRRRMYDSIPQQGQWLRHVISGYINYYAVSTDCGPDKIESLASDG
jgi:RNA-directed DNA polymerase